MNNFYNIKTKTEYNEYMNYLSGLPRNNNIYTNEFSLKEVLIKGFNLAEDNLIHNKQFIKDGYRFRPDYRFTFNNIQYIVEFQGYQHFTDPNVLYKDSIKRNIYNKDNCKFIEIPYFIQVNDYTFEYFFGMKPINKLPENNFCHGFVHPKSKSLGEFSVKGKELANNYINKFPNEVYNEIIISLQNKSKFKNIPLNYLT